MKSLNEHKLMCNNWQRYLATGNAIGVTYEDNLLTETPRNMDAGVGPPPPPPKGGGHRGAQDSVKLPGGLRPPKTSDSRHEGEPSPDVVGQLPGSGEHSTLADFKWWFFRGVRSTWNATLGWVLPDIPDFERKGFFRGMADLLVEVGLMVVGWKVLKKLMPAFKWMWKQGTGVFAVALKMLNTTVFGSPGNVHMAMYALKEALKKRGKAIIMAIKANSGKALATVLTAFVGGSVMNAIRVAKEGPERKKAIGKAYKILTKGCKKNKNPQKCTDKYKEQIRVAIRDGCGDPTKTNVTDIVACVAGGLADMMWWEDFWKKAFPNMNRSGPPRRGIRPPYTSADAARSPSGRPSKIYGRTYH